MNELNFELAQTVSCFVDYDDDDDDLANISLFNTNLKNRLKKFKRLLTTFANVCNFFIINAFINVYPRRRQGGLLVPPKCWKGAHSTGV